MNYSGKKPKTEAGLILPYFCINLARRPDRWDYMTGVAETAGISLTRVEAVDASAPETADAIAALTAKGPTGIVGTGALACTLSHARAWSTFLETEAEIAVFFEDDVVLSSDFKSVVAQIAEAPLGFDLIKLECGGSAPDGLVLGPSKWDAPGRALRPCYQIATDAAGYMLTRKGADAALSRLKQIDVGVDHYLFYPIARKGCLGVPFAIVDPAIVIQDRQIGSNISQSRYVDGKWRRMLRRTAYEAAPVPHMIWNLVKGARVRKVPFKDKI